MRARVAAGKPLGSRPADAAGRRIAAARHALGQRDRVGHLVLSQAPNDESFQRGVTVLLEPKLDITLRALKREMGARAGVDLARPFG